QGSLAPGPRAARGSVAGQVYREGGAGCVGGGYLDGPAVRGDDALGDVEAQAETARRAAAQGVPAGVPLLHRVEDAVELVGRDRHAAIVDHDRDPVVLITDVDVDCRSLRTVLHRVADQVAQCLR